MTNEPNAIEATELALYAVNDGDLYRQRATPIMENLVRKHMRGTYDATLALKAWQYLADDAAKAYRKEFSMVGGFDKPTREAAAKRIADYYAEGLAELVAVAQRDRDNAAQWSLATIKAANEKAGRYFFSRDTMRFFGDTMGSFRVRCFDGKVYLQRVKPMRERDGRDMGGVGDLREFDPASGEIGSVGKPCPRSIGEG